MEDLWKENKKLFEEEIKNLRGYKNNVNIIVHALFSNFGRINEIFLLAMNQKINIPESLKIGVAVSFINIMKLELWFDLPDSIRFDQPILEKGFNENAVLEKAPFDAMDMLTFLRDYSTSLSYLVEAIGEEDKIIIQKELNELVRFLLLFVENFNLSEKALLKKALDEYGAQKESDSKRNNNPIYIDKKLVSDRNIVKIDLQYKVDKNSLIYKNLSLRYKNEEDKIRIIKFSCKRKSLVYDYFKLVTFVKNNIKNPFIIFSNKMLDVLDKISFIEEAYLKEDKLIKMREVKNEKDIIDLQINAFPVLITNEIDSLDNFLKYINSMKEDEKFA
jgi:sulfur relay (sulfurtransferase) DsrC/TusE family protein